MANDITVSKNSGIIAKAAAGILADTPQFSKSIDVADASDYEGKNGYKAGDTIKINIPPKVLPQGTFDITSSIQDITETQKDLTLDIISTVGLELDSLEITTELGLKQMMNRVIVPAAQDMAADIEHKELEKATDAVFNSVGTPGSNQFDTDIILQARERINKNLAPKTSDRFFLSDGTANRLAVNARKGLFQSATRIAEQYDMGYIGTADGFNWMENELLNVHTNGNDITGVALNTVTVTNGTSSASVSGLTNTTGTIKKGQIFTLSGVKAVHPQTKTAFTYDQQFVVTADVTADGSGNATISFSPAIYISGSLQNVASTPSTTNALVFVGAADGVYTQNLAYHKQAFRRVSAPLEMPTKAELMAQMRDDSGSFNVALIRDFDVLKRRWITRLDYLGGLVAVRPEWACRVPS